MDVATFCLYLARSTFPPGGFVSEGRRVLGDTYDDLVKRRVLKPLPQTDRAPCEGGGTDCPRLVVPRGEGLFLAYCASAKPECRNELLPATALTRFELDAAGLLRFLAGLAGIKGVPLSKPVAAAVYDLGRTRGERGEVAVFLALRPAAQDFLAVALGLVAKEPGAAVVLLVPLREEVPAGLPAALEVRGVSLVYLDESMRSEGEEVWLETERIATAGKPVTAPPLQPARRAVPYCLLIARGVKQPVSREEYEASLKARASVALLVDATARTATVYRSDESGQPLELIATPRPAMVLARLMEASGRELKPEEFFGDEQRSVDAVKKALKRARELIEGAGVIEVRQRNKAIKSAAFKPPREGFMLFLPLE